MCIEWDGATTVETVAPVRLPLVPSLHASPGPAPLSSLAETEALENGGKGRLKTEMGSCSEEHKSLPSSWLDPCLVTP